jgi:hypothetical protein
LPGLFLRLGWVSNVHGWTVRYTHGWDKDALNG